MDYLGLDDLPADLSSSGFAGAGGVESTTTTGRLERKKIWLLASEFRGEVPKQSQRARSVMIRPLGSCNWTRYSSIKAAAEALCQPKSTVHRRCRRNSQVDGYEYEFAPVQQVELPGEEWRPMIDPRSGRLVSGKMLSSHGRIKLKAGRISLESARKDGYLYTKIRMGSKTRCELVHRLVAASFLGPPPSPDHSHINHKDASRSNNAVGNLEYVTPAENSAHRSASLKGPHHLSKGVLSRACEPVEPIKSGPTTLLRHRLQKLWA